ncbi:hypothetical protein D3C87_77860 [compost metagenome]
MYLVKPNGNYNILISDINVAVSHPNSILVEKKKFDSSANAKGLLDAGFILIEDADKVSTLNQEEVETKKEETVFVAREEETKISSGIFVRQPEEDKIIIETPKIEEIIIEDTTTVEVVVEEPVIEKPIEEVKIVEEKPAKVAKTTKVAKTVETTETPVEEVVVTPKTTNKRARK